MPPYPSDRVRDDRLSLHPFGLKPPKAPSLNTSTTTRTVIHTFDCSATLYSVQKIICNLPHGSIVVTCSQTMHSYDMLTLKSDMQSAKFAMHYRCSSTTTRSLLSSRLTALHKLSMVWHHSPNHKALPAVIKSDRQPAQSRMPWRHSTTERRSLPSCLTCSPCPSATPRAQGAPSCHPSTLFRNSSQQFPSPGTSS